MKNIAKKLKTKKMFAIKQIIQDFENPDSSTFEIIGVYASKNNAKKALEEAKQDFWDDIPHEDDENLEDFLDGDCDHAYNWTIEEVKVYGLQR